ncbi:hypothetical protein BVI1335_350035 [Burkholderia vietnamiensis]|nr:hypothetical protein BVI1335_350035 [Burkholderia vietnamiensis]
MTDQASLMGMLSHTDKVPSRMKMARSQQFPSEDIAAKNLLSRVR